MTIELRLLKWWLRNIAKRDSTSLLYLVSVAFSNLSRTERQAFVAAAIKDTFPKEAAETIWYHDFEKGGLN